MQQNKYANMNMPLISLVMINYNREKYIESAINSVLMQTNPNWELVIIEDGSSDGSIAKIKPFLTDERIKLYPNEKNCGIVYSRIKGVNTAQAEIIGTIDSDDYLEPEAVDIMIKAHQVNNSDLIYSQMLICDENLKPLHKGSNDGLGKDGNNLIQNKISHFFTFKKSAYLKTSGYDWLEPAEDKDILYKLEELTDPVFIDKILYRYRLNPASASNYGYKKLRGRLRYFLAKYNAYRRRKKNNSPKKISFWQIFPRHWFIGLLPNFLRNLFN